MYGEVCDEVEGELGVIVSDSISHLNRKLCTEVH
jgi:hypothetical protein